MPEEGSNFNETLAKLFRLLNTRGWLVVLVACVVSLAAIAVIQKLPNQYTSEATVLVIRQQVPERYVVPTSTTDITAALNALKQDVLSRTRLTKIINDFDLYQRPGKHVAPESLVDRMLSNTDIQPITDNPSRRDFDAFKISFIAESPVLAQSVVSNLTSLLINEHLRSRTEQASTTSNFLHDHVVAMGKQLEEQEQKLRDFKMQHIGELPEQQAGNLGILSGLQGQLQNTMQSIARAQEHRVLLESMLNSYKRQALAISQNQNQNVVIPGVPNVTTRPLTPVEAAQNEVARLQSQRATLLSHYTADYPDVVKKEREIARAEDVVKRLKATAPARPKAEPVTVAGKPAPPVAPIDMEDPSISQVKSQLEANRMEVENLTKDEKRLKASISQYESRLNQTPVREQQEAGMLRETQALRLEYAELQKKEQDSQLASSIEKEQVGQQFRLVDPPSLPMMPSKPKRLQLSLGAIGGGFALGLALVFFLEMKDTSFLTEKDFVKRFSPPFIVGIPLLPTRNEERRRKWVRAVEWLASAAMLCVVLLAEYYVYKHG